MFRFSVMSHTRASLRSWSSCLVPRVFVLICLSFGISLSKMCVCACCCSWSFFSFLSIAPSRACFFLLPFSVLSRTFLSFLLFWVVLMFSLFLFFWLLMVSSAYVSLCVCVCLSEMSQPRALLWSWSSCVVRMV